MPVITVITYLIGTIFYISLIELNYVDFKYSSDYIQSGEAALCPLIIIIILRFFTGNILIIAILTIIFMAIAEQLFKKIFEQKNDEIFINGILIHIIAGIVILYLKYNDKLFNQKIIHGMFSGYFHTIQLNPIHISILFIVLIILCFSYIKLNPEIMLFSHGHSYFKISGFNYNLVRVISTITRNFLLFITICLLGWMNGIGYYIYPGSTNKMRKFETYILIILYTQLLIMLARFFDYYYAAFISVSVSYIIYLLMRKKRINIYDRN